MHPLRYLTLIEGVSAVYLTGVHPLDDQNVALRLVSLPALKNGQDAP